MSLVIKHDLSKLSPEELTQYLRDVSTFIGLDPDLNAFDTLWMQNENGPGQSLVVYARRGTAEILRNLLGIEISSLIQTITPQGSIVFTATGKNARGRQEIAIGSKYIASLTGKALDDAIMTASTRALRRVTMQFTSLGILDESEVGAVQGSTVNPAAGATLAGSAVVLPPAPSVPANNAPGRDVTPEPKITSVGPPVLNNAPASVSLIGPSQDSKTQTQVAAVIAIRELQKSETPAEFSTRMDTLRDDAQKQLAEKATGRLNVPVTNAVPAPTTAPVTAQTQPEPAATEKPKRARKPRNTVSIGGPEPEVVNAPAPTPVPAPQPTPVPAPAPAITLAASIPAPVSVPERLSGVTVPGAVQDRLEQTGATSASAPAPQSTDFPGKPTETQMGEYRKRVSVYTSELPSSENMGSVQKMRAFIAHMSGTAPQFMTTDQWQEMLSWFESFVERNKVKGLVTYINDSLGVK